MSLKIVVALALTIAASNTAHAGQVCVPTTPGETALVNCFSDDDFVASTTQAMAGAAGWPYSPSDLAGLLAAAKVGHGVGPNDVLVVDHSRQMYSRQLSSVRSGTHPTLTVPLPAMSTAGYPRYSPDLSQLLASITIDAGENTDGGEFMYGPPGDWDGWLLSRYVCDSFTSRDSCKSCCSDAFGAATGAATTIWAACMTAVSPCFWCYIGCTAALLVVEGILYYQYDGCRNDHCNKTFWNDTSVSFTGGSLTMIENYGWGQMSDVQVYNIAHLEGPSLALMGSTMICALHKDLPLYAELEKLQYRRLLIAYEGSPCAIRDYRVIDPGYAEGEVRYSVAEGAFYLQHKAHGPLRVVSGTGNVTGDDRNHPWADGAKVLLQGEVDLSTGTYLVSRGWQVRPGCTPTTCEAQGKNCGTISDGCGRILGCGDSCPENTTCGGSGVANVCACPPTTCSALGKNCGTAADGCGGTLNCGTCSSPYACGGGGQANICGCTPKTCSALGKNCGTVSDQCGGTLSCGTCTGPQTCGGGGQANICGCVPKTCSALGKNCGTVSDQCGGTLSCGTCTRPQTCGGGGQANVCGSTACGGGTFRNPQPACTSCVGMADGLRCVNGSCSGVCGGGECVNLSPPGCSAAY